MFLNNITRRKLALLLRPWLLSEPDLEVKLGLINSQAIAKHLRFDSSILNELVDDHLGFCFNDVTIEQLIVRFSNWSVPALSFEVHGFHVALSVRNSNRNLRQARKRRETFADGVKKKLSQIDPEGTLLHSVLERMSSTTLSGNKFKTAFLNLILKHCQLQMHNVNLQVQFPVLNDSSTCVLHLKELNAESEYLSFGCLFRGLVGAAFKPVKESSYVISGSGFEIGFKMVDQVKPFLFSASLSICIKLNDFQLIDFNLLVPELSISFSPADLLMYVAFSEISSKESQCARNGRLLWRLAASRVGHLISAPRLTFHNLVVIVGLWLRYVNAYEYILQLVGYSADDLLKRSATKMSQSKMFLSSVKQQWKVISDIEKELPVESIAQARRIARYRAALNVQSVYSKEFYVNDDVKFFCKIFPLFGIIWKLVFKLLHFFVCLLLFWRKWAKEPTMEYIEFVSDDPSSPFGFIFSVGRILVNISHVNENQLSEIKKLETRIGIPFSNLVSFSLSVNALLFKYREDICEQSLVVSCGQFKVKPSSLLETLLMQDSSKNFLSLAKEQQEESNNHMESILWFEPAQTFTFLENSKTNTADNAQGACDPFLENCLGQMWSNWEKDCVQFEKRGIQYSENPFLLLEMTSLLTYPGLKNSYSGFWKFFFTLGKFHLGLRCSSILSISLLLRQIQHVLCRTKDIERSKILLHSPGTTENPSETSSDNRYKFRADSLRLALLKMLPENQIQLGAFIVGPCIRLSLEKEFSGGNKDRSHTASHDGYPLSFDMHNIEVAIWPTSTSNSPAYVEHHGFDDAEPECIRLEQPRIIDIPKSDNAKYISDRWILLGTYLRLNGFTAYMGDSADKQRNQILVLQPMTFQFSSTREYFDSFSTNVIACSAALCITATGLTVLSYVDEFYALSQVLVKLYSAVSYLLSSSDIVSSVPSEIIGQKFAIIKSENKESTGEEGSSICRSTIFLMSGILKVKRVDVSLQKTRINKDIESSIKKFDALSRQTLAELDLPDCGILISIQQTNVEISCEGERLEIVTDFSEICSVVSEYENQKGKSTDHSVLKDLLLQSHNCLYEISFSNCTLALSLFLSQNASSSWSMNNKFDGPTSGSYTSYVNSFSFVTGSEMSSSESSDRVQKLRSAANAPAADPSDWLFVNIVLGMVYVGSCSLKNALIEAHESDKLLSSLSVGGEFEKITCGIQGGLLFLDTQILETFIGCFSSYLYSITYILSDVQPKAIEKAKRDVDVARLDDHYAEYVQETLHTPSQAKGKHVQALTINFSQLSIVLVIDDEKGGVQELVLEFDVHLNFELANMTSKFLFDLKRLSTLSRVLHRSGGKEFQIPRFYSVTLDSMSRRFASGESTSELQHKDNIIPLNDPSRSRDSESAEELSAETRVPEVFNISYEKHILKHLGAFLLAQKHVNSQAWVGSGSVSGFDIVISLSEMEMVSSVISSLSGVLSETTTSNLNKKQRPSNEEEFDSIVQEMVPNGSIVAIQDVHQHTYFAVDGEENKYSLVGTIHYSLVGERALFRVKYHQRRWKSSTLWFSLISLHAKNDLGEPFRLNYRPGSGFVDISSTDDGGWASWRTLSCEPESYDSDIDWEPYNQLVKRTFYLVNKKNECAVAFVDGVPEFVRKPGNPFKFKVFDDLSIARDVGKTDSHSLQDSRTSEEDNTPITEGKTSGQSRKLPCIDIICDKISLTIVHDISDTSDLFPLLRASIDNIQLNVQVLSTKCRIISSLSAAIYCFDSQRYSWKELLHPVEIFCFYRSSFHIQGSEGNLHGVPVHIHCRTKELNMSLTELSLDILLFVIGKLNLAGPYLLKGSRILVTCCKVENQTGVNLLCHFFNKQSMKIARKQSTSMFLRYSDLAKQPAENAFFSFKLAVSGSFTTSSISLSLLQAQQLAWRTRMISSQDSRTYPGPYVVVDISRESEDGLSIIISPLIRIHNETKFSMELRFRRPHQKEDEFALVVLKPGDTIDDSIAMFDALHLSGGMKKALTSLSLGNFLFSFRPDTAEGLLNSKGALSVDWSHDLKGGKAVHLSGIFDKLGYKVRKALLDSVKCSFSTAQCSLNSEGSHIADIHFLIQTIGRDVPVVQPNNSKEGSEYRTSPVTLQEQKEIIILPTVKVSNLLQLEIHVILSEMDACSSISRDNTGNQATVSCGSSVDFYVNPSVIFFTVTLTPYNSSCRPVNSSDWVKKLQKQKTEVHYLDIDLEFGNGNCFASLRLSRGHNGMLEATVFTSYALKNDTDFSLYFFAPKRKPLTRREVEELGYDVPPELGVLLPPKSTRTWFLKSNKVRLKLLEDDASEALLDLDALSGLTEISLETEESVGVKSIAKLGVSMGPSSSTIVVPSRLVTMVPRYVVVNESEGTVSIRQCYLQDDTAGINTVHSKQRTTLQLWNVMNQRREFSFFETFIKKHGKANDDALVHIQFQPNEPELSWSGPVCVASLGRFFIKFRKPQSGKATSPEKFAAVHIVEEGSTLVLHYHRPPNVNLPYRIENCSRDVAITYYQKDSSEEPEVLGSESSADYVWDDMTLPHKLMVRISDSHSLREINLDKVRGWKPFYKFGQHRGLAYHFMSDEKSQMQMPNVELKSVEMVKVGYEVYADGHTRVLRFCEICKSHKRETVHRSFEKIKVRVPQFTIQLLEQGKQGGNEREASIYTPIIAARFGNFCLDSLFTDQQTYNLINLLSLTLEPKWVGAPFAAMLRRHQADNTESNDCILRIVCVLLSDSSDVTQVQYSSIALQPIDLNVDEETLMKVVPFWRTSLSDSVSRQYYFDHFEIQPIKIISNFLPGESYSSYSSAQETLRSLLHSVIKVPPIKNMVVELNGVLVTHALITMRELCIRCAKHYSWYAMRAIYIAKGSPLLPPDFVSMFDDLASSSLDAFFDPSRALMNLPGLTLGTLKFVSKCIGRKGFSGTKRYFGDLGKSLQTAGSNVLFTAVSEISDSVLKGAEASGFNGMVTGFHQGILKLAMEPSLLGSALMEGGPDRKIKLDRSPGVDELYIEGYLQAMLDTLYRQEYLRVRVIDNQVYLKNLPPNNTLIEEIVDHVKGFLVSKALLKGDPSRTSHPLRHLRGESEWKLGPTLLTLCEHLFVSFAIRMLRKQANKFIAGIKWKKDLDGDDQKAIIPTMANRPEEEQKVRFIWRLGIGKFVLSGIVAYVDGRLCRCIPNPIARRIVSGFLLTFLDKRSDE